MIDIRDLLEDYDEDFAMEVMDDLICMVNNHEDEICWLSDTAFTHCEDEEEEEKIRVELEIAIDDFSEHFGVCDYCSIAEIMGVLITVSVTFTDGEKVIFEDVDVEPTQSDVEEWVHSQELEKEIKEISFGQYCPKCLNSLS